MPHAPCPSALLPAAAAKWRTASSNHHLLTLDSPDYPQSLKHIADPPKLLYVIGNVACLNAPQLAIVGSRRMTHYGKDNAHQFGQDLARKGLTITSGLAYGIDASAHQGALAAKGHTIAVLGSGIDHITPTQHQSLAQQIVANQGAIVSEFPLGTPAHRRHFPQRNRIITGMSIGTLVIEAALKSGSLISARLAMEQNRTVFAIPGSIHSPMSKGCHQLLKQGAKCVECSDDILIELKPLLTPYLEMPIAEQAYPKQTRHTNTPNSIDDESIAVLKQVDYDVTPIDSIIQRCQQPVDVIASILLILELNGYVQSTAGGYIKCRDINRYE